MHISTVREDNVVIPISTTKKKIDIPSDKDMDNNNNYDFDIENIDWLTYMSQFVYLAKTSVDFMENLKMRLSHADKEMMVIDTKEESEVV